MLDAAMARKGESPVAKRSRRLMSLELMSRDLIQKRNIDTLYFLISLLLNHMLSFCCHIVQSFFVVIKASYSVL